MQINLTLFSKNKRSIKNFYALIIRIIKNKKFKTNIQMQYKNGKNRKKKFTILKSPHVNKTAQDQYEYTINVKKIKIYSFQTAKFLIILKKLLNSIFSDVHIKIQIKSQKIKSLKKYFKPTNYSTHKTKIPEYLKLFTLYGKCVLNKY